jgi:hypothetical protein
MFTLSCLPLITVVFELWAAPSQFTTALLPKLLPLTVMVKPGPPADAEFGLSCEMAGTLPATGGLAFAL